MSFFKRVEKYKGICLIPVCPLVVTLAASFSATFFCTMVVMLIRSSWWECVSNVLVSSDMNQDPFSGSR